MPQGATATVVIAVLPAWAILMHPGRGDGTMRGESNTTFTISTTTSSETVTTQETVRVDVKKVELCIPSTAALP